MKLSKVNEMGIIIWSPTIPQNQLVFISTQTSLLEEGDSAF